MAKCKKGDSGPAVIEAQTLLVSLGYAKGLKVTGTFDAATVANVRQLQTDYLLTPTGVWTDDLKAAASLRPADVQMPPESLEGFVKSVDAKTADIRKAHGAASKALRPAIEKLRMRIEDTFAELAAAARVENLDVREVNRLHNKLTKVKAAFAKDQTIKGRAALVNSALKLLGDGLRLEKTIDREIAEYAEAVAALRPWIVRVNEMKAPPV